MRVGKLMFGSIQRDYGKVVKVRDMPMQLSKPLEILHCPPSGCSHKTYVE